MNQSKRRTSLVTLCVVLLATGARGQTSEAPSAVRVAPSRLAVLAAEDRRAPTLGDLATIRAGLRSRDPQAVRIAVRALGRLERPDLIADILPVLEHPLPEIRSEAATAVGQAAHGWSNQTTLPKAPRVGRVSLDEAAAALLAKLVEETDPNVRAVLGETIGRLPYTTSAEVERANQALMDLMARSQLAADRLGVAKGFEANVRLHRSLSPPTETVLDALRALAVRPGAQSRNGAGTVGLPDSGHDARVRRLALEALIAAEAADDPTIRRTASDPDGQVRRLAVRALSNPKLGSSDVAAEVLKAGLVDVFAIVRMETLRSWRLRARAENPDVPRPNDSAASRSDDRDVTHSEDQQSPGLEPPPSLRSQACDAAVRASRDTDPHVALVALDSLADCSALADAVMLLERTVKDPAQMAAARSWHQGAHAIVALAAASPEKAAENLNQFVGSTIWQARMYGARAAATLKDRARLETLARDTDDNVREVALEGLRAVVGHDADAVYIAALERGGNQVLRAAANALSGSQVPEAVPALKAALHRLVVEGRDNSHDARQALAETLKALGVAADPAVPAQILPAASRVDAMDLPRLASARARLAIRGVGSFELMLLGSEAPASVFRFVRLAESGYYNGLTFHRVVPNFVIQGGSPGANEYIGDASFMRDEVGEWPHVRGAVGISTRGRDTGDVQIFVDLVDNPRLDHEYTVFAHVLTGMDVVDAILEGDVIERVDIIDSR
jgi:cyclophilin family peptidyl-prolyl cis-trans isomerase/HEAT repeat protein